MKKISLVLVMVLVCSIICTPINSAFARTNENSGMTIYEYAEQLAEEHPNWEIRVVNDTLHIVNHEQNAINGISTTNSALEGGTYSNFSPPLFYPSGAIRPFAMYLIPGSLAKVLYVAKNNPDVLDRILKNLEDYSVETIINDINNGCTTELTYMMGLFFVGVKTVQGFIWLDKESFNLAYESANHNMCITQYTLNGWPSVMYQGWNGVWSPYPYEDFEPVGAYGVYDGIYQVVN